jgi:hypothetical protein
MISRISPFLNESSTSMQYLQNEKKSQDIRQDNHWDIQLYIACALSTGTGEEDVAIAVRVCSGSPTAIWEPCLPVPSAWVTLFLVPSSSPPQHSPSVSCSHSPHPLCQIPRIQRRILLLWRMGKWFAVRTHARDSADLHVFLRWGSGEFGFGRSRVVGGWECGRRRRLESGLKLSPERGFEWGLGAVPVLDLGLRPLGCLWRGRLHRDRKTPTSSPSSLLTLSPTPSRLRPPTTPPLPLPSPIVLKNLMLSLTCLLRSSSTHPISLPMTSATKGNTSSADERSKTPNASVEQVRRSLCRRIRGGSNIGFPLL